MLKQEFIQNTKCTKPIDISQYNQEYFNCYDKDGFDLTPLEQAIYKANGYDLYHILNRDMLARPWLDNQSLPTNIYIDHCVLFMRCCIEGECKTQINKLINEDRRLLYLLKTRQKWGIDIDINWIEGDKAYEIIHIELDSYEYEEAVEIKNTVEEYFNNADLTYMAQKIIDNESLWSKYNGLSQNDWKARYFGFNFAEETKKSY